MANREEILLRMGLDHRPLQQGLQTVSARTGQWAHSEGQRVGKFFTRGFEGMFRAFSVAGAVVGLRQTAEEINSLKDNTEELEKRFGKLGDAQLKAAGDISEGFRTIERTGKKATITIAASFSTLFEVLASKLTTDLTIGQILDDMASQAVKDVGPRNLPRVQELIAQYRQLKKEIDFSHMDLDEQIKSLQDSHATNLKLIEDENTLAEEQIRLATENLKISDKLDKLLVKKMEKGGEFIPLPEDVGTSKQPISPVRQEMIERQESLRRSIVQRFGDPTSPGYRDPLKAKYLEQSQIEVNEALMQALSENGALRVTPDE